MDPVAVPEVNQDVHVGCLKCLDGRRGKLQAALCDFVQHRRMTHNLVSIIILSCMLLVGSGCSQISLQQIASLRGAESDSYTTHEAGQDEVKLYRNGQSVEVRRGMALHPGDEIETSEQGSVIIRFAKQGRVTVFPKSKVRIGSLEVLFGKIFADVRGLFSTSGGAVTAGVEGTQYLFEVDAQGNVRTLVVEGAVNCSSRDGRWSAKRVSSGSQLWVPASPAEKTSLQQVDQGAIREIMRQVEQINRAP